MRVEQRVEGEEERLSTEELHALRARLFGETSSQPKAIATVADLAEALGRTPEEVWRQLDRLRAEKEFSVTPPAKTSQMPLVGVALVLLASAYGIYQITPRKLSEAEIDQRLEQVRQELAARPRKVHYPIPKVISMAVPPLPGFGLRLEGELTKTTFQGRQPGVPVSPERAVSALKEVLKAAYDQASRQEAEAPKPLEPLKRTPNPYSFNPSADQFVLTYGAGGMNLVVQISTDPNLAGPQLDQAAQNLVENLRQNQERALSDPPENPYAVMPPPGFQLIAQSGTVTTSGGGNALTLSPIDAGKVRHLLEGAIRDAVRRTMNLDELPIGVQRTRFPGKTLDLEVRGPLRPIKVTMPMAAGGEYKTAADAIRAFERKLSEVLDDAEKQIREINARNG